MSTIIGTTLNADTIRKTGGSLGTDIRVKNTSVYESEGGTSVTQNLVNGLAKSWFLFNGNTPAITDSLNISSLDDDGVGQYGLHYTNNFATANQALGGDSTRNNAGGTMRCLNFHTTTTSTVDMDNWNISSGSAGQDDAFANRGAVFGDLA